MCRLAHLLCIALCLTASASAHAEENSSVPNNPSAVADLTISQWIQPAEAGLLKGRIVTSANDGVSVAVVKAQVAVVNKEGKVLRSESLTNDKGEFTIKNVQPGVYALSARSGNHLAACAMHILSSDDGEKDQFASEAEVSAAAIDFATLQSAIVRYLPTSTKPSQSAIEPLIQKDQLGKLATQVVGTESFRVAQINGGMEGQIFSAGVEGSTLPTANVTNVFIMKDGKEVARTLTNDKGEFQVSKLALGSYSLMAIGPEGLGLTGFELVNQDSLKTADQVSNDGERFVGLLSRLKARRCAKKFCMQVAPVCNSCSTVSSCTTCEPPIIVEVQPTCFQPVTTFVQTVPVVQGACGCGQPAATCGCGIPVDPCGSCGTVVVDGGYIEGGIIDGMPIEGEIIDGGIIDDGFTAGGLVDGGGYAPGYGGGGGGFSGGGGGGGGLLGGGGLGGIAALAGIGGLIAVATSEDDDDVITPAPILSPAGPVN